MILEGLAMGNFTDDEDRWNEFKNRFTEEDKASMESILKKTRINTDTGVDLSTTLTKQERTWSTNFAWRAFLWGFC
jgi:uncharacterized protein YeaO (DUF488 family)